MDVFLPLFSIAVLVFLGWLAVRVGVGRPLDRGVWTSPRPYLIICAYVSAIILIIWLSIWRLAEDLGPMTGSRADPIAEFVKQNMRPASAGFFAPTPIARDEPSEAVLEIGPPSKSPLELHTELRTLAGRPGVFAGARIEIAPRMIANLTADRPCTIVAKDPLDRAIPVGQLTKWRWTVTPMVGGSLNLTATLTAPVIIDGKETGYSVTSFDKTVTVVVSYQQHAGDAIKWAKEYWPLVGAAGGGTLAFWAWLRRKKSRPVGF